MMESGGKKILFYTEGPTFDGGSISAGALGGSETALVQAARALRRRGHDVTVLNNTANPGVFEGVTYLPRPENYKGRFTDGCDVFIVSRNYGVLNVPIKARLKVLWNHDTLDKPSGLRAVLDRFDLAFVLSRFHRDNYLTRIPGLESRLVVTRNGLDFKLLDRAARGAVRDQSAFIYASRPERGLKNLLEDIWPRLVEKKPDSKLYLCGYNPAHEDLAPGLTDLYEYLDRLAAARPEVTLLGSLAKEDYYRRLAGSAMMLYPCVFPEISCIAALEAQACQTPIVATDGFALSETIKSDLFKIHGRPGEKKYNQAFVSRVLELLDRPGAAAGEAARVREVIEAEYDWDNIVGQWDRVFELALRSKAERMSR